MKEKTFLNKTTNEILPAEVISRLEKFQILKDDSDYAVETTKKVLYFDSQNLDLLKSGGYCCFVIEQQPSEQKAYFEYKKDKIDLKKQRSVKDTANLEFPAIMPEFNDIATELGIINPTNTLILLYDNLNFPMILNNLFLISNNLNPSIDLVFSNVKASVFNEKQGTFEDKSFDFTSLACNTFMTYNKKTNALALEQLDMALDNFCEVMKKIETEPCDEAFVDPYKYFLSNFETLESAKEAPTIEYESLEVPPENNDQNQIDNADLLNEFYDESSLPSEEYDPVWGNMDSESYDEDEEEIRSLRESLPFDESEMPDGNFYFDEEESLDEEGFNEKNFEEEVDKNDIAESQFGEDN